MKINEYNQMMSYLTRPAETSTRDTMMAGGATIKFMIDFILRNAPKVSEVGSKISREFLEKMSEVNPENIKNIYRDVEAKLALGGKFKDDVKKGEAPKTDVEKVRAQKKAFDETEKELAKEGQIPVRDDTGPKTKTIQTILNADQLRALGRKEGIPEEDVEKFLSGELGLLKRGQARGVVQRDKEGNIVIKDKYSKKYDPLRADPVFKDEIDPNNLTTEQLIEFRKTNRAGKGQFTNAEAIIARLENTIKETSPDDETYEYVTTTFPNFIKELKANPKLAENENVWNSLMSELPSDQRFVKYDDGTVDFQTKKTTHNFKLREDLDTDRKGPNVPDDDPNMFDDMFDRMQKQMQDYIPGEEPLPTKKKRTLNAEGGVIGEDGMFQGTDLGTREGFAKIESLEQTKVLRKFIEDSIESGNTTFESIEDLMDQAKVDLHEPSVKKILKDEYPNKLFTDVTGTKFPLTSDNKILNKFKKGMNLLEEWKKNPTPENWIKTFQVIEPSGQKKPSKFGQGLRNYLQGKKGEGNIFHKYFKQIDFDDTTKKEVKTYDKKLFNKIKATFGSAAARTSTLETSAAVARTVGETFLLDPQDTDITDIAKALHGKKFDKASDVEKVEMLQDARNGVQKFYESLTTNRPIGLRKKISGEEFLDIIENIETNSNDFGFQEGQIRDMKMKIRDDILGEKDPAKFFRNLRNNVEVPKGKVIDEVFSLSGTYKRAPGYMDQVQFISNKVNKKKASQIDLPLQNILTALDEGKATVQYNKKQMPIEKAIQQFNKDSRSFAKTNKVKTAQINFGGKFDPSQYKDFSSASQKNIADVFKDKNYFLTTTKTKAPSTILPTGMKLYSGFDPTLLQDIVKDVAKTPLGKAKIAGDITAPFVGRYIGLDPKEAALDTVTAGFGSLIKDQADRYEYAKEKGFGDQYLKAREKMTLASNFPNMDVEKSNFALTDDENYAFNTLGGEYDNLLEQKRTATAQEYSDIIAEKPYLGLPGTGTLGFIADTFVPYGIKAYRDQQKKIEQTETPATGIIGLPFRVGMEELLPVNLSGGGRPKDKKNLPGQPNSTLPIDPNMPQDPGRRNFLEKMGIGSLGIGALMTGAVKLAPEAVKAVKKATPDFSSTNVPAIVEELYSIIKNFGKQTEYPKPGSGDVKYEMGPYKMEEGPGGYSITKTNEGEYSYSEEYFGVYKDPETGAIEYEELTVKPDMDGKLKDVDYGVDAQTYREIGEDLSKTTGQDVYKVIAEEDIKGVLDDGGVIMDQGVLKSGK